MGKRKFELGKIFAELVQLELFAISNLGIMRQAIHLHEMVLIAQTNRNSLLEIIEKQL